jgi:hypothetical protein
MLPLVVMPALMAMPRLLVLAAVLPWKLPLAVMLMWTSLLPVAGAGMKLLLGPEGASLRQRLLLTLVQGDRLHTDDLRALLSLMRRTFSPRKLVGGVLSRLSPMAA